VFAPLKAAYRDQVERLYRGGANIVGKQHFTSLYSPAREAAFTKRNILAAWAASGLFPFNPDRVLRGIPKPSTELTVPKADGVRVEVCPQDEVPRTPATPLTAEALTSLHSMIKQDAHSLAGADIQRLQRHIQKLANAAQISFAERALLQDQTRFLSTMNNEAKSRRSTKSLVLGKAKVMSYEDIEEARAKRAAKEEAKAKGKEKPSRKRKSTGQEADTKEPEADTPGLEPVADTPQPKSQRKRGRKNKNAVPEVLPVANISEASDKVVQMSETSDPVRAPVIAHIAPVLWTSEVQVAPVARMM